MRLWTLHPIYLDAKGLVALWREALLAQKVLQGNTKGYRHHPQLIRFASHPEPEAALATYLAQVHDEATRRGYRFDASKISPLRWHGRMNETRGQLLYEWQHLMKKLEIRDPERFCSLQAMAAPEPHPLFHIVAGPVKPWERPSGT